MPGRLFVGVDVGTTTSKAVVFTEDGDPVASGRTGTPWSATASGAELDATALLDAATSAIAEALAACPSGPVGGLGVTSMAESGVLLDRRGQPVAPVIAWHDTRDEHRVGKPAGSGWRTDVLGDNRFALPSAVVAHEASVAARQHPLGG